jgi:hypothetical protein
MGVVTLSLFDKGQLLLIAENSLGPEDDEKNETNADKDESQRCCLR